MIRRRQGVGTFVAAKVPVIETGLEVLESISTIAQRSGLPVRMGKLLTEQITADREMAVKLAVEVGTNLTRVARIIYTDDRPIAYLIDTLPVDILSVDELQSDFTGSVLDLLLRRGEPKLIQSRTDIKAMGQPRKWRAPCKSNATTSCCDLSAQLYTEDSRVDRLFNQLFPARIFPLPRGETGGQPCHVIGTTCNLFHFNRRQKCAVFLVGTSCP